MTLEQYIAAFRNLNVNRKGGHASPHKVCMLLAVMDLIESGTITDNKIYFNEALLTQYQQHFSAVQTASDRPNPHLPFFHLMREKFWHHQIIAGREDAYHTKKDTVNDKWLRETIAYAWLDDELFELLKYSTTRELLKYDLLENIDQELRGELSEAQGSWTQLECELITADYLNMLLKELRCEPFVKSHHREDLKPYLNNRSDGSIEYKHQNISAILIDLGLPYIKGYKPAFNYQRLLSEVVASQVGGRIQQVETSADVIANDIPAMPVPTDWQTVLAEAPHIEEKDIEESPGTYRSRIYDYAEKEQRNRSLGKRGEEFVLEFEKQRLAELGRKDLAKKIEWTSQEKGDGAGFDIQSYQGPEGEELFIEVKTTNSGKYQPFFITDNEVAFSEDYSTQYSLYRVFEYRQQPRIFTLAGSIRDHVRLAARQYRASFR